MCLFYDHLLVHPDAIISLASLTHVARSNSHELYHNDENFLNTFVKFESESGSGTRYFIWKWTLRWDIQSRRCWLPTPKIQRYNHNNKYWNLSQTSLEYVLISKFHSFQTPTPPSGTPRQLGTIQMHILQSIWTNGRVKCLQHMPWWGIKANGLYYKHMCIIYPCIYMQCWQHNGEHLCVCNRNFKLQQGQVHYTQIIYDYNYNQVLVVNNI
jgi:hypothetical protein